MMMKHILNLQSDYSKNGGYIQLSLPIHTETLIPVDDSVRLIDQVLEEIDYRELYLWDIPFLIVNKIIYSYSKDLRYRAALINIR